jgi:hypothetical protein
MRIASRVLGAAFAAALAIAAAGIASADEVVTKPIDKPFSFSGYVIQVTSIQTVATPDARAFLSKMNDCSTPYVMLVLSVQNNSAETLDTLTPQVSFELADGSDLNGPQQDGMFLYPNFAPIPSYFHPKEHKSILYVTCNWNGQAVTKLFLTANGPKPNNVRMIVPKTFAGAASPVPTASP